MIDKSHKKLTDYFKASEGWAHDQQEAQRKSLTFAWMAAAVLGFIAIVEGIALVVMLPLKSVVPYTLMVDRQTGSVELLKPLERQSVAADQALTRSFLAQYVIAREGFDINSLQADYRKVGLWSAGEARQLYMQTMQAGNADSPLSRYPRNAVVDVKITGVSSLSPQTSLVRYATIRRDGASQQQTPQYWQAVITYRFSHDAMTVDDRLLNPLGFQVTRYRRNMESPVDVSSTSAPRVPDVIQSPNAPAVRGTK